ncbi:MAG: ComEC/Rec2 family competence protein [Armatimonadota bacterium]|nr:ComEC/Rec2 family competence protein [Armatimonadota bacterium]
MRTERLYTHKNNLVLISLAIITLGIWFLALSPRERVLEVTLLDVGNGDCIFVQTPSGKTMLVDGGGRVGISKDETFGLRVVAPFIRSIGVSRIDIVVLTHPHEDHVQGLVRILKDFRVGMVLDSAIPHASDAYSAFLGEVESRSIDYRKALRGQVIDFGDGVRANVLHPPYPRLENTTDDINNNSIVLRITFGKQSVILTGDAGFEAEKDMLAFGLPLRSTVLKVAHHGSKNATSDEWVQAVSPKIALVSVGRNNAFGQPSSSVLKRLEEAGAKIYRTDRNGAVRIRMKPSECQVYPLVKYSN